MLATQSAWLAIRQNSQVSNARAWGDPCARHPLLMNWDHLLLRPLCKPPFPGFPTGSMRTRGRCSRARKRSTRKVGFFLKRTRLLTPSARGATAAVILSGVEIFFSFHRFLTTLARTAGTFRRVMIPAFIAALLVRRANSAFIVTAVYNSSPELTTNSGSTGLEPRL